MNRKFKSVIALTLGLLFLAPNYSTYGSEIINQVQLDSNPCLQILSHPQNGLQAVDALGSNLKDAANLNGKTERELNSLLLNDSSFWLDRCGRGFYVEAPSKNSISGNATVAAAPYTYDLTFKLHSKPGSSKTIYLDFNGYTYSNSAWNSYFRVASTYYAKGYSQDTDYATFTTSEMDVVQSIWQRVSEDYAPFDVDVTTEEPAFGVIERDTSADTVFGTRAVITGDGSMQSVCGCGGVAYIGVFDEVGYYHDYYQPAWVFATSPGVGTGAKSIAEAISHEVGHNLGLKHDGTSTSGYYQGTSGWAPIMGVGYYQGLVQWSQGEYPNANNFEDDFAVMSANGISLRMDEDSNSSSTARPLASSHSGFITSRNDKDWFSLTPSASSAVTFQASVATVSPDLDIKIDLYAASNPSTPISTANPIMSVVSSDSINGLSATMTVNLSAGTTYFLVLDGVGNGDPLLGGYSDFGSLGAYSLQVTGLTQNLQITTSALSDATAGVSYLAQLSASGGTSPYIWAKVTGPSWLTVSSSGAISGTPTTAITESLTVTVTDSVGTVVQKTFSLLVKAGTLTITNTSLPNGSTRKSYSAKLNATGGSGVGYTWTKTAGTLPAGLTFFSNGTITGTPTSKGTFTITVQVVDSLGASASKSFTFKVN